MVYEPFPAFTDWKIDFDPSLVEGYSARLCQAKATATPEAQHRALQVATRYAAVDTGAIEGLYTTDRGFTKTIATQGEFWQRALDLKGEQVRRSIEGALAGYDYVLDAVTGSAPITTKWIRELHAVITKHQKTYPVYVPGTDGFFEDQRPLPHGEYKQYPNNPTSASTGRVHYYAPPEDTPAEMARLIDELNSDAFRGAHPVIQAAYAHYAYICVHPFADGNGRVARALASVYLYRDPGVPLVIFADQRDLYLDALEAADAGRPSSFVQFVAQRVIDTVNMVVGSLGLHDEDDTDIAAIAQATRGWPGEELVLASQRLQNACASCLADELLAAKGLPSRMSVAVDGSNMGNVPVPAGYVIAGPFAWVSLTAVIDQSSQQRYFFSHVVAVATEPNRAELLVVPHDSEGVPLEVWLREIDPVETTSLRIRLDTWAQNVVRRFIKQLSTVLTSGQLD